MRTIRIPINIKVGNEVSPLLQPGIPTVVSTSGAVQLIGFLAMVGLGVFVWNLCRTDKLPTPASLFLHRR